MQLTKHARQRMQERQIDQESIELALTYGRQIPAQSGRIAHFIGHAEIEACTMDIGDLLGIVVITAPDKYILTCWKAPTFAAKYERRVS